MPKKLLKSGGILTVLVGLASLGILVFSSSNSRAASDILSVNTADLSTAGFTDIKQLAPITSGRFSEPNLYFSVSDKTSSKDSEAPNVVMVDSLFLPYTPANGALFNYGLDSHTFQIFGGAGKEATMADGRFAINFIKNNNYIVVIGPSQAKVEVLATTLASKIQ